VTTESLTLRQRLRAGPRGPVSPLGRFGGHPQSPAFYYDPSRKSSPASQASLTQKRSDSRGTGLSGKSRQGKVPAAALWLLALGAITALACSNSSVAEQPNYASPLTFKAQVVRVLDGDTIHISAGGQEITVRLTAIDSPESGQRFGEEATRLVSELVSGKQVIVRGSEHDKYGRLLADVVLLDGCDLSRRLVASGNAWWYRKYAPNDKVLEILENEARQAKRGLWTDPNPMPPWDFRHGGPDTSPAEQAQPAPTDTPTPQPSLKPPSSQDPMVYVTATGKKYHTAGCRYLPKRSRAITLSQAKVQGYSHCKVCKPPH